MHHRRSLSRRITAPTPVAQTTPKRDLQHLGAQIAFFFPHKTHATVKMQSFFFPLGGSSFKRRHVLFLYSRRFRTPRSSYTTWESVDQVLDSLGKGRVFSLFDLVSSFHQITAHKDTVPLTAFSTPTGLYEWLVMPQGSSASPGWFVKTIKEVTGGLEQVAAYLDDAIVFDSDPSTHVKTIRALLSLKRRHRFCFFFRRLLTSPIPDS